MRRSEYFGAWLWLIVGSIAVLVAIALVFGASYYSWTHGTAQARQMTSSDWMLVLGIAGAWMLIDKLGEIATELRKIRDEIERLRREHNT